MSDWFVYMVETRCGCLYTGICTNIAQRFNDHLEVYRGKTRARGAKFFRGREPLHIVYCERLKNRAEASVREWQIKKLARSQKLQLARANFLDALRVPDIEILF